MKMAQSKSMAVLLLIPSEYETLQLNTILILTGLDWLCSSKNERTEK